MAARTTSELVKKELLDNFGKKLDGEFPDLVPFIKQANNLTTRMASLAISAKGYTHTSDELLDIETVLSAWAYCMSDRTYSSRSTGGASGSFDGQTGKGLDANFFGQKAKMLDASGVLKAIDEGKVAGGVTWLGKHPRDQIPYYQRR